MRPFAKFLTLAGVIVAVIILGVALGWFGVAKHEAKNPVPPVPISNHVPQSNNPETHISPGRSAHPPSNATLPVVANTNKPLSTNPAPATTTIADWEDKLETILAAEGDDRDKARQMLQMFARLPEDGQVEVAQHLSNLVADEDYAQLKKLLVDAKLPEEVLDVLIADILNRPNSVKLPTLLEVARNDQHPKAGEAKDLLELYLEEDYGQDWNKWQSKTEQWLKDNPD
jgi:hypothetical protein